MNPSILCIKGCGFYGSEENKNMCSKCYTNFLKTELLKTELVNRINKLSINQTTEELDKSSIKETNIESSSNSNIGCDSVPNRCNCCKKKVGLMGFKCRCGDMFCSKHRYPVEHQCPFDYKKFEREILKKENPLIRSDKLEDRI